MLPLLPFLFNLYTDTPIRPPPPSHPKTRGNEPFMAIRFHLHTVIVYNIIASDIIEVSRSFKEDAAELKTL